MLILFGSAHKSHRERPLLDTYCYSCDRDTTWDWYRVTEWITAYFLHVLPIKDEHFLVCSSCMDRMLLTKDEAVGVKTLKQLAPTDSQALHDHLVSRLEAVQLAHKTETQREYLKSRRT